MYYIIIIGLITQTTMIRSTFKTVGVLTKVSAATAAVYATASATALIYEPLQEPFQEYVPGGEWALDKTDYVWTNRAQIAHDIASFDYKGYYNEQVEQIESNINKVKELVGMEVDDESIKKKIPVKASTASKDDNNYIVLSNSDPIPAVPTTEIVDKNIKKAQIPLLKASSKDAEPLVKAINKLISDINESSEVSSSQITQLEDAIKSFKPIAVKEVKKETSIDNNAIDKLAEEKMQILKESFESEKTAVIKELTETVEATKKSLESKHKAIIENEKNSIEQTIHLEYENKLKQKELELLKTFNDSINEKIETERNGKLSNLKALNDRIKTIEQMENDLSKVALSYTTFKEIRICLSKINSLIVSNSPSDIRGESLVKEISNLKKLSEPLDNKLINTTIESFPSTNELLLNGGVLTQSQILSRWELLIPQLRSVSLLPENPGILGYISSSLASKLLWSKSGVPIKTKDEFIGNDVESVIARVNDYLQKNKLDDAVEEVTSLKGVPREIANDWIVDARRKLEIQFLLDILSTEVNVSA